jgi:hypothetical protein
MKLCKLAQFVLFVNIFGSVFDVLYFGFSKLIMIFNIIGLVVIVWLTNWGCLNQPWVAWLIFIYHFIAAVGFVIFFVLHSSNDPKTKSILEESKNQAYAERQTFEKSWTWK